MVLALSAQQALGATQSQVQRSGPPHGLAAAMQRLTVRRDQQQLATLVHAAARPVLVAQLNTQPAELVGPAGQALPRALHDVLLPGPGLRHTGLEIDLHGLLPAWGMEHSLSMGLAGKIEKQTIQDTDFRKY
jgi:hypothetical protein